MKTDKELAQIESRLNSIEASVEKIREQLYEISEHSDAFKLSEAQKHNLRAIDGAI